VPCNLSHRARAAKFHKILAAKIAGILPKFRKMSPTNPAQFAEFYKAIFYQNSIKFRRAVLKTHGKIHKISPTYAAAQRKIPPYTRSKAS